MKRQARLEHEWVRYLPEKPELGVLYVSREYNTATHLCCCGCGMEVVTPLNAAKWRLTDHGDSVSLGPSIGNWSFPCQSHYWISRGEVEWVGHMTDEQIARVRYYDHESLQRTLEPAEPNPGFWQKLLRWFHRR